LEDLKSEDKKLMKKIIKDIQTTLLTHNGFVTQFREYRDMVESKIEERVTQATQAFEEKYADELEFSESDGEDSETDSEDLINPLRPVHVSTSRRRNFRRLMKEKERILDETRKSVREEFVDKRVYEIQMPFKNPTTIEQRTYNDPRTGVTGCFIPNDSKNRPRGRSYQLNVKDDEDNTLQHIHENNPEYDLLS